MKKLFHNKGLVSHAYVDDVNYHSTQPPPPKILIVWNWLYICKDKQQTHGHLSVMHLCKTFENSPNMIIKQMLSNLPHSTFIETSVFWLD